MWRHLTASHVLSGDGAEVRAPQWRLELCVLYTYTPKAQSTFYLNSPNTIQWASCSGCSSLSPTKLPPLKNK